MVAIGGALSSSTKVSKFLKATDGGRCWSFDLLWLAQDDTNGQVKDIHGCFLEKSGDLSSAHVWGLSTRSEAPVCHDS